MCIRDSSSAAGSLNPAKATVTARSLRVRGEPDSAGTVVGGIKAVSYTHLRAHETVLDLVCRLLLEKKKQR